MVSGSYMKKMEKKASVSWFGVPPISFRVSELGLSAMPGKVPMAFFHF